MPQTLPVACSLDQAALADRASFMKDLGGRLVGVEVEGVGASLRFQAKREQIEAFVELESSCCPFFDFTVEEDGGTATLRVEAPEDTEWAVRWLVAGFVAGWGELT